MSLVFVHGVNNREGPDYDQEQLSRNAFFQGFVFPIIGADPVQSAPLSPYWGGLAANFAWDHESLPEGDYESFGAKAGLPLGLAEQLPLSADQNTFLLQLSRQSTEAALDLLCSAGALTIKNKEEAQQLAKLAQLFADYSAAKRKPAGLATATDDRAVLNGFQADLTAPPADAVPGARGGWEHLGGDTIWSRIDEGLSRIKSSIGAAGSRVILSFARSALNDVVSRFLGDIFVYLDRRGTKDAPGPIVQTILASLRQARTDSTNRNERLVLVAHSMGGIIAYDILTYFAPDLVIDALVTVGSQVALFEELKLFRLSSDAYGKARGNRVLRPVNVRNWLNVFDFNDVLSFSVRNVFDGPQDFAYDTGVSVLGAHSGYFIRPSFYRRLAERLKGILA